MAKHITRLTIPNIDSAQASQVIGTYAITSDGTLPVGMALRPHLETLPITWTFVADNRLPHFGALATYLAADPRVQFE